MQKCSNFSRLTRTISKSSKKMVHSIANIAYDERPQDQMKAKQWREDWED